MTITIKARTAAFALALFCVLAGLAIGQLTQANSAPNGIQVRGIESKLAKISDQLGGDYLNTLSDQLGDIDSELSGGGIGSLGYRIEKIQSSSSGTCRATGGYGC